MIGRPDLTIVENTELPPPAEVDLQTIKRPAIIGPGDELAVDVFGLPEASRAVRVDAAGKIAVPLAGTVEASDRTAEELAGVIAGQLRAHSVRDPQVTVNVINSLSQAVTVDGAVKTPGQFAITGRTTLMRAIARGGGVTEFAQTNHVVVFRRVNEQDMAARMQRIDITLADWAGKLGSQAQRRGAAIVARRIGRILRALAVEPQGEVE